MTSSPSIRRVVLLLVMVGCLSGPLARGQAAKPEPVSPGPSKPVKPVEATDPMAVAIVEAHNKYRADAKLPPLAFAPLLAQAATVQAADMAEHEKMQHEGSDGSTPSDRIKRTGYHYQTTGENIAMFYDKVPQVMQVWFDSPPHKKNILGDFTELGVAKILGDDGKFYWCVDFAKPMPQFDPSEATSAFVAQLNKARTETKHPKLAVDSRLAKVAQDQAAESAKTKGKGGTPTAFSGLDTNLYAELAMSTAVGSPTAESVLKMFLENANYKERLLGPSTKIGVGYATDGDGTPYWCLILAKPVRR